MLSEGSGLWAQTSLLLCPGPPPPETGAGDAAAAESKRDRLELQEITLGNSRVGDDPTVPQAWLQRAPGQQP